jgi:hypothetical protein
MKVLLPREEKGLVPTTFSLVVNFAVEEQTIKARIQGT